MCTISCAKQRGVHTDSLLQILAIFTKQILCQHCQYGFIGFCLFIKYCELYLEVEEGGVFPHQHLSQCQKYLIQASFNMLKPGPGNTKLT